jgi:hypothetical protein
MKVAALGFGLFSWDMFQLVRRAELALSWLQGTRQISPASRRPVFRHEAEATHPAAATTLF